MCKRKKQRAGIQPQPLGMESSYHSYTSAFQSSIAHIRLTSELVSVFKYSGDKLVVIDFYATWCGPCQKIAPILENWVDEYPDVLFIKVNVENCDPELLEQYKVKSVPTFIFLKKAKVVGEFSGGRFPELKQIIETHRAIEAHKPPSLTATFLREGIIPEKLNNTRQSNRTRTSKQGTEGNVTKSKKK